MNDDVRTRAEQFANLLHLTSAPVAIAFLTEPPAGVQKVERAGPSSCSYWLRAANGEAFYTDEADQTGCAVGAFTHGVPMAKNAELEATVGTMVSLQYISMDEVAVLPHRTEPVAYVAYAPLGAAAFTPDVVLFKGTPKQIMLLAEAAQHAGAGGTTKLGGRPTCAMIPGLLNGQKSSSSLGCIGNRVYTGLADDELYFGVKGSALDALAASLQQMLSANAALEQFHRDRALASS